MIVIYKIQMVLHCNIICISLKDLHLYFIGSIYHSILTYDHSNGTFIPMSMHNIKHFIVFMHFLLSTYC